MFTTERIANGIFNTFWNGEQTQYNIINGSLGVSGNGRNEYGITDTETGKTTWVGSLQKAKKTAAHWAKVKAAELDKWEPVSAEEQERIIAAEVRECRARRAARHA